MLDTLRIEVDGEKKGRRCRLTSYRQVPPSTGIPLTTVTYQTLQVATSETEHCICFSYDESSVLCLGVEDLGLGIVTGKRF